MLGIILVLILSCLSTAALTYALVAIAEGQWDPALMGGIGFVAGVAAIVGLAALAQRGQDLVRYRMIREQRLVAPAVVNSLKRIDSEDDGRGNYRITATVFPPDLPPYRTQFDQRLDPITDAGVWQRGMAFRAQLVNIETGGVIHAGKLDAAAIPESDRKPKAWEAVRCDYIDGDAAPYHGPKVAGVKRKSWRSVEVPEAAKPHPLRRPMLVVGAIAGIAIMALLCQGSIANTIERVQRGEMTTTVYESSVIARAGAQDILDRSGSDKFYAVFLNDNNLIADVPSERAGKVEDWRTSRDSAFLPGTFEPWTEMTITDYNELSDGTAFGIDDVRWETLPKIVSDAREVCKRDYPAADLDFQQVLISVKNDQLQFEYRGNLTTGENCNLSYTMAGKPIGR